MTCPRGLALFVSEDADVPKAKTEAARGFGLIYAEPYAPRSGLSTESFSARVLSALVEPAWQPTQSFNTLEVVLTPGLPGGQAMVVADGDHRRVVGAGLSPARWRAASVAEKRRLLVEVFVQQLEPLHAAWSLDWAAFRAGAQNLVEAYATITRPQGKAGDVVVGPDLAAQLERPVWNRLSAAGRIEVARAAAERAQGNGREVGRPEVVVLPSGESIVRATAGGTSLVLVPGGRLKRGFDAGQLARLDEIYRELWRRDWDTRETGFPRSFVPFGADMPCPIDGDGEVAIPPMWVAEEVSRVADEPRPWDVAGDERDHVTTWRRALGFVDERGFGLPTSDELLWAASAGDGRLFPWGDDAGPIREVLDAEAYEVAAAYGDVPREDRSPGPVNPFDVFAGANAFGLTAPLSHATWCMPVPDLNDPAPLVQVGGAVDRGPWQGGWEAMLFLTRVVSRVAFDGSVLAPRGAVRPILRLGAG